MTDLIHVPVATGELIDKITILEIKVARIADAAKAANAQSELSLLAALREKHLGGRQDVAALGAALKEVNERIWDLEDTIRDFERRQDFGDGFVAAARAIYRTNDRRAALKREINLLLGSPLIEEKSYAAY